MEKLLDTTSPARECALSRLYQPLPFNQAFVETLKLKMTHTRTSSPFFHTEITYRRARQSIGSNWNSRKCRVHRAYWHKLRLTYDGSTQIKSIYNKIVMKIRRNRVRDISSAILRGAALLMALSINQFQWSHGFFLVSRADAEAVAHVRERHWAMLC